jgi:hypothetical protein
LEQLEKGLEAGIAVSVLFLSAFAILSVRYTLFRQLKSDPSSLKSQRYYLY